MTDVGPAPVGAGSAAGRASAPRGGEGRVLKVLDRPWLGVPRWMWAASVLAALVAIGPGLAPGAWLNLDLVVLRDNVLPRGAWGLGPEIPRRVPLWILVSWFSTLLNGEVVGRAFVVACIALAACGAYRLVGERRLTGFTAAVLYGMGPFLATRVVVGHWMVVWAMAVLPWAVADLSRPWRSARRVLWWSAALGVAGVYGGVLAGAYVVVGLFTDRSRPAAGRLRQGLLVAVAFVVGQLPWLVPLAIVGSDGQVQSFVDSSSFRPPLDGVGDVGRLLAGLGFWNPPFQVARGGPALTATVGFVVLLLAVVGTRRLSGAWRWAVTVVGLGSLALAAASAVPGLDDATAWFTRTTLGAPFRETQRYLAPFLLWAATAAATGARVVADRLWAAARRRSWMGGIAGLVAVLPLVGALMLANGASWGFGGQLESSTFPSEWAEARRQVAADPGTVVAFPWFEYFSLDIADNRLVLNVVPFWFGGDTVASTDPMLTPEPTQESTDPREASGAGIAEAARAGEPVADALARLGVRWVVLQHDIGWQTYTGVLGDPGLEPVVEGPTLTLYRVRPWAGLVVGDDGKALDADPVVSPLMTVPASGPATWAAPYQDGWLRGTSAATQTADGLVALPGGSGPVWFWPAVVVLVADLVVLAAVVATAITRPRGRWARRREARRVQLTDATS